MTACGIPTVTCVLLLLFMAALYGNTSASEATFKEDNQDIVETMQGRLRRSPLTPVVLGRKPKENKRGPQGRSDDTADAVDESNASGRRKKGKKPSGSKRPSSLGGMHLGVNRKTLGFAEKVGSANFQFASKMLKAFYPKLQYDTIVSPYSIHTALSMVLLGAKRKTAAELFSVLGLQQAGVRKAQVHKGYHALQVLLGTGHENVILNSTNAVFAKPNVPIEAAFRKGLAKMYDAKFDFFNFSHPGGPEAPINEWVSNATHKKISELLSPGSITPLTSLVLVNAIFFNASWEKPFSASMTAKKPFTTLSQGVKDIDTMAISNSFKYVSNADSEVIELPFRGGRFAMYIIVPAQNSTVDQIVEELSSTRRDRLFRNMEPTPGLYLEMPKFKIEAGAVKLKAPLQKLGIKKIFSDEADLSGISSVDLHVEDVIHNAVIEVNERGSEASAATAVLFARRSGMVMKSKEVKVDRPFVFAIMDNPTKTVLFSGAFLGQAK